MIQSSVVKLSLLEVHELSVKLTQFMIDEKVSPPNAAAALALTLGRMTMPMNETPDDDKEVNFVQELVQWCSMFWTGIDGKES